MAIEESVLAGVALILLIGSVLAYPALQDWRERSILAIAVAAALLMLVNVFVRGIW